MAGEASGKAIGLMQSAWAIGYLLAAILAAARAAADGDGGRCSCRGCCPPLVTLWIRRSIPEPPKWTRAGARHRRALGTLFRPPLRRQVLLLTLLCSLLLFGYWGMFTWLPAYLSTPVERGGAGLSILRSSAWIVPLQIGAFFGYISFGFLADRVGRRPAFLTFVLTTAVLVPVYGLFGRNATLLLAIGPLMGYFGHGYFSVFGAMMAELFPAAIRDNGAGLLLQHRDGRVSGLAPVTVGALADRFGHRRGAGVHVAVLRGGRRR